MKKIIFLFLMGLSARQACAQDVANLGRQFLLLPHEARESAMGGTFASLSDTAMGVFCNPAALAPKAESEIALTHLSWFGGANEESAAYVRPLEGGGVLAGGLALYWIE